MPCDAHSFISADTSPVDAGDAIASGLARLLRGPDVPTRFGRDWERLLRTMTALDPAARPPITAVAAELRALRFAPARR